MFVRLITRRVVLPELALIIPITSTPEFPVSVARIRLARAARPLPVLQLPNVSFDLPKTLLTVECMAETHVLSKAQQNMDTLLLVLFDEVFVVYLISAKVTVASKSTVVATSPKSPTKTS